MSNATALNSKAILNVPNQITVTRFILSVILFVLIGYEKYYASTIIFSIAAGTDWMDGFYARKYGQVTTLGRILDPFCDKVIICGTFIMLAAVSMPTATRNGSGIMAWMAVLVMGRELLVTTLRSFLEAEGRDFSANWPGKFKMVFQCAAVIFSLVSLQYEPATTPEWMKTGLVVSAWLAIASTIYSGVIYIFAAAKLLREQRSPSV